MLAILLQDIAKLALFYFIVVNDLLGLIYTFSSIIVVTVNLYCQLDWFERCLGD
jgi:hypothetical protein